MNTTQTSLLRSSQIPITDLVSVQNSTVGSILDIGENVYYQHALSLTSTPYDVQASLHMQGIDYETINDYDLFCRGLIGLLDVGDNGQLTLSDSGKLILSIETPLYFAKFKDGVVLSDRLGNVVIDELVAFEISEAIRKLHFWKRNERKPGNKEAKEYILQKELRRYKRAMRKPPELVLEPEVVALVNNANFPYDYESVMGLNIYSFNQSVRQIMHTRNVDFYMQGIYSGCIDSSKIDQKSLNIILPSE